MLFKISSVEFMKSTVIFYSHNQGHGRLYSVLWKCRHDRLHGIRFVYLSFFVNVFSGDTYREIRIRAPFGLDLRKPHQPVEYS
jgi:hypothetical protein